MFQIHFFSNDMLFIKNVSLHYTCRALKVLPRLISTLFHYCTCVLHAWLVAPVIDRSLPFERASGLSLPGGINEDFPASLNPSSRSPLSSLSHN